jgi:hypothetical protein
MYMTKKQKNKITKIKEILHLLWSSYEHMYEARETGTKNSINFLLIIVTFLPILCLTLYIHFKNPLLLFPILFQVLALLILLKSFFIKGQIPWLELKSTLLQFDNDSFEVDLLATLKAAENGTYQRLQALSTIIKRALFLLIFSIFLITLACLFMILEGSVLLYIVTVLLLIVFLLLYLFYKDIPSFEFNDEYKGIKKLIEKWLKD